MSWIARTRMVARTARPCAGLSAGLGEPMAIAPSRAARQFHSSPQRQFVPSRVQSLDATHSTLGNMEQQKKLGQEEEEQQSNSPEEEEIAERRAKLQRIARRLVIIATIIAIPSLIQYTGIIDFYRWIYSCWPQSVRVSLRAAIKAERKGQRDEAEVHYANAEAAALEAATIRSGQRRLADDPSDLLQKLTGIGIARASNLEELGRLSEAFQVYSQAFDRADQIHKDHAQDVEPVLGGKDRMRSVVIAQKLGDVASSGTLKVVAPQEAVPPHLDTVAEKYYAFSIEEMLRLVLPPEVRAKRAQGAQAADQTNPFPQAGSPLDDLELPEWVTRTDLGASMEAFAGYYLARNQPVKAAPLYLHALSLFMPSDSSPRKPETFTVADRCHAGVLFSNLSSALTDAAHLRIRPLGQNQSQDEQADYDQQAQAQAQLVHAASQGLGAATQGLNLVRTTQTLAGFPSTPVDVGEAPIVAGGEPKTVEVIHTSSARTAQVRDECKLAEASLLYALGRATQKTDPEQSNKWFVGSRRAASLLVAPPARAPNGQEPIEVDEETKYSASELLRALHDELGPVSRPREDRTA